MTCPARRHLNWPGPRISTERGRGRGRGRGGEGREREWEFGVEDCIGVNVMYICIVLGCIAYRITEYAGFNPKGGTGGGFQLPPQAYDTMNNPSPTLPNMPPQVSTIINFAPSRTHV